MKLAIAAVLALGACGPALGGLPHPNNALAAGAAAAIAGAITIANPSLAGHKPEADIDANGKAKPVQATVPAAVFDRLDNPAAPEDARDGTASLPPSPADAPPGAQP